MYPDFIQTLLGRHKSAAACLLLTLISLPVTSLAQSATRSLPAQFAPGEIITVRLEVTPPEGTTNWTVHEFYPANWTVAQATNASGTNDLTSELTFGPFQDAQSRSFSYQLATLVEWTSTPFFSGHVAFDDNVATLAVGGATSLSASKEWEFVGPQVLPGLPVSGTVYGAGRWVATSIGWSTTMKEGGPWSYPLASRDHFQGQSRMGFLGDHFLWWGEGYDSGARMAAGENGLVWKPARSEVGDPLEDPFGKNGFVCSVAYGNGIYVAVGSQARGTESSRGAIWRSTNAYHWTRVFRVEPDPLLNPSNQLWLNLEAVAYGDGRFIAVGNKGMLVTSTDGLDWLQQQPLTDPGNTNNPYFNLQLTGVLHGPHGWMVTSTGAQAVVRSTDGLNWSQILGNNLPASTAARKGGFYRSFVADGKYWFTGATRTLTTVDGTAWQTLNVAAVTRAPDGVTPRYLGGTATGQILTSENGTNWTVSMGALTPPGSDWPSYQVVLTLANESWISGIAAVPAFLDWNRPLDYAPTKNIWAPAFEATSAWIGNSELEWSLGEIVDNDQVLGDYVMSGADAYAVAAAPRGADVTLTAGPLIPGDHDLDGSSLSTLTRSLTNVLTYAGFTVDWGWCKASLCKTALGFDLYAEAGKVSDGRLNPTRIRWGHFSSPNGSTWTRRAAGLNDVNLFPGIRGLAWGAGRFVAVGEGSSPGVPSTADRIYSSTDGENYSPVNLAALNPPIDSEGLTSVAFHGGAFVAVGNQGRILFSTDGLSWATVRAPDGKGWNRVRFLGSSWALVGSAGRTAFSPDGQIWTLKATGFETDLNDVAAWADGYLVAGNNGVVLRSLPPALPAPRILRETLLRLEDGSFRFSVQTEPNLLPLIEMAPDLVNWTVVSPAHTAVNASGVVTFTDAAASGPQTRFYRARLPE